MSQAIDSKIGERLRFFRIAAGMKQRELAEQLSLSYQQVQKYEMGKDRLSVSRLLEVSDILGVRPVDFLDPEKNSNNLIHNRQSLNLMRLFTAIDDEKERQLIVDLVKGLAEKSARKRELNKEES